MASRSRAGCRLPSRAVAAGVLMVGVVGVLTTPLVHAGSSKKGLCVSRYEYHCDDLDTFDNIAWWYDWKQTPWYHVEEANCTNPINDRHRVPMVWSWREGKDYPLEFHNRTSQYVLGFNEPNHRHQANLTPKQAALAWRELEARADRQNQRLVSPSAIKCTSGSDRCMMTGVEWFTEFFRECHDCRVDFLATHMYTCDLSHVMDFLHELHTRFGKQIWLTEVACPTHSYSHALAFMQELLPRLEAAPHVFRYSWYNSRVRGGGAAQHEDSLLHTHSSTFTTLGKYYNDFM